MWEGEPPEVDGLSLCCHSEMIRSATPFPLVSLFFMFIGFILSNIGHIRPHRTILAFVSGIFFILSGKIYCFVSQHSGLLKFNSKIPALWQLNWPQPGSTPAPQ